MTIRCYTLLLPLVALLVNANTCPENFISLGSFCYHFSDVEEDWNVARGACLGIGSIKNEYIIPAVLDLGTAEDNELLLSEVNKREDKKITYWLGGYRHLVDDRWQWIYNIDKDIDPHANYWLGRLPHYEENCTKTTNTTGRAFITSANCIDKNRVICQIIPNYFGFRDIGKGKYYFPNMNDNKELKWAEARDVCQSMTPPNNYDYVDLASLPDPDTAQQLLRVIAQYEREVWLGGYSIKNESVPNDLRWSSDVEREFKWVNKGVINQASYFLDADFVEYVQHWNDMLVYATIRYETGEPRATIRACLDESYTIKRHFICQAY